jgi:hypothetical protein
MRLGGRFILVGAVLCGALAAGCAAGGVAPGAAAALMLAMALGGVALGCSGGEPEADGRWMDCCQDGRVESCFCPALTSCNFCVTYLGGGACSRECWAELDAGTDAGEWQGCCEYGVVTACYCPAGVECNYGWYTPCGEGTCVDPWTTCPGEDAGVDGSADAVAGL